MAIRFKPVNTKVLKSVAQKVRLCKKEKHRPTVAALVRHAETQKYLLIHPKEKASNATSKNPGIVKGGIKKGEGILTALYREIEEELSVTTQQLILLGYGGSRSVRSVKRKSGLLHKRYFFFHLEYIGSTELVLGEELSAYHWLELDEVDQELKVLLHTRAEKYTALGEMFRAVQEVSSVQKKKQKDGPRKKGKKRKK